PRQARRRPQLPRPAQLPAGCLDGHVEATLGDGLVVRLSQVQLALETVQLGLLKAVVVPFGDRQALVKYPPCVSESVSLRICLRRDPLVPHLASSQIAAVDIQGLTQQGQCVVQPTLQQESTDL